MKKHEIKQKAGKGNIISKEPNEPHPSWDFSKDKFRIAPEPQISMQPPWKIMDEVYSYVAQDGSGAITAYEEEPVTLNEYELWVVRPAAKRCGIGHIDFPRGNMPWDKSLVKRPEGV